MGDFDFSVNMLTDYKLEFFFESPSCVSWIRLFTQVPFLFRLRLFRSMLVWRFYREFSFSHFKRFDFQIIISIWFLRLIFGFWTFSSFRLRTWTSCFILNQWSVHSSSLVHAIQNTVCSLLSLFMTFNLLIRSHWGRKQILTWHFILRLYHWILILKFELRNITLRDF